MTDFRFDWQDTQAGDRVKAAEDFAYNHQPSAASIFTSAIEANSVTARMLHMAGTADQVDPNYVLTPDAVKATSEKFGIPMENMGFAADAASEQHLNRMAYDVQQTMQAKNTLSAAGWKGSAASMLTSVLDPVSLATMFTPAGVTGWMQKGGAFAGAVKSGLVAGGINAGLQAGLAATDNTSDPREIVQAGLMGLALGAPLGALSGHLAKTAHDGFIETVLRKAKEDGHVLTPAGDEKLRSATIAYDHPTDFGPQPRPEELKLLPYKGIQMGEAQAPTEVITQTPGDLHAAKVDAARQREAARLEKLGMPNTLESLPTDISPNPVNPAMAESAGAAPDAALFKKADSVTWEGKDGVSETGKIHEVLPNGQYIIKDANGNLRTTRGASPKDSPGEWMGGSIGSGQRLAVESAAQPLQYLKIGKWKVPLRFDAYNYFQKGDNPYLKSLGNALLENETGNVTTRGANGEKIFSANHVSAEAYAGMTYKQFEGQAHNAIMSEFDKYAQRVGMSFKDRITHSQFFEDVTKIVRGDQDLARANPEAAAAAREVSSVNKIVLEKMKAAGIDGAENIVENGQYMMRKFDFDRLGLMLADKEKSGRIHQLITEAILKVRPELAGDLATGGSKAEQIAKQFVAKIRKIPTDKTNLGFLSDQGRAKLGEILRQGGALEPDEIEHIMDWVYGMQPNKAAEGASPRLKYRTFMDENHSISWVDEHGATQNLAISDLLVNDVRALNRSYYKQAAGLIGLAKVGYRSRQDLDEMLSKAEEHALSTPGVNHDVLNRQLEGMRAMIRGITGLPIHEGFGSMMERGLRTIRNVNYITYMAQGAFAQATEYGQVLAMKTMMAMRTNMSEVNDILRMAEAGTLPKQLSKDLHAMGIIAEETSLRQHVWTQSPFEGTDRLMTRVDNAAAQGASWISKWSGMAPLTDFQRGKLASLYSQRLLNLATGAEKMNDSMLKRLATNGLEGDELESVFNRMREHATVDPKTKELVHIDYAAWERQSQRTYDLFRLAVYREAHRGIQEISLGGTPIWMHRSTAKLMGQFRSFVLNAWTKQLLYGVNHMDLQTFANWSFTTLFGSMAYAAQTALNYGGSPDLDKRLAMDQIALAGFNKAGYSSLIPAAWDTMQGMLLGTTTFSHARSTGLGTGAFAGSPTVATANKVGTLLSGGAQSVFTNDHMWTRNDVRQSLGLLPNYYGIRTLVNNYAQEFPTHNFLRPKQQ